MTSIAVYTKHYYCTQYVPNLCHGSCCPCAMVRVGLYQHFCGFVQKWLWKSTWVTPALTSRSRTPPWRSSPITPLSPGRRPAATAASSSGSRIAWETCSSSQLPSEATSLAPPLGDQPGCLVWSNALGLNVRLLVPSFTQMKLVRLAAQTVWK